MVSRSLTYQSKLTLVHAFASAVLTAAVLCWLGWTEFSVRLPVLLGGCPSFLPSLPTCVMYCIGSLHLSGHSIVCITALVSRCVLGCAPSYLRDLCCPVSILAARRVLRSAARDEFLVRRTRLVIMQRKAFSVVCLSAWNDLPIELRSLLMAHHCNFYISSSFLSVTGLGAPLSSSLLKRRYISLQN